MTTQAEFRERRMAWVEALRSERYNQVFGWLHATEPDSGDQFYCCFGVACEVSNLADWQNATQMDENDDWERGDYYLGDDTELPNEVVEYYGLASNDGAFEWQSLPLKIKKWLNSRNPDDSNCLEASLRSLNDSGHTFSAIATIIEAEPEGLFVRLTV